MSGLLERLLDDTGHRPSTLARVYRVLVMLAALAAAVLIALDTLPARRQAFHLFLGTIEYPLYLLLSVDFALRALLAARPTHPGHGLREYLLSPMGLIDLVAALPFFTELTRIIPSDIHPLFGVVFFLKVARYSPALHILRDVVVNERKTLLSSLYVMLLLTFTMSTLMYYVERHANPAGFASIPQALWWSVVTLSTLGYGDVVPVTPLGKLLGGIAAILGFGMFALPAAILANGFADEIRHLRQVGNWNLVASVPLFADLESRVISEIAQLLKLRRFIRHETIVKVGDTGDSMYFIIEGEIEVVAGERRVQLFPGDFFGEIALLKDGKRTATAIAKRRCRCLELTAYDFRQFIAKRPELMASIDAVATRRHAADQADRPAPAQPAP